VKNRWRWSLRAEGASSVVLPEHSGPPALQGGPLKLIEASPHPRRRIGDPPLHPKTAAPSGPIRLTTLGVRRGTDADTGLRQCIEVVVVEVVAVGQRGPCGPVAAGTERAEHSWAASSTKRCSSGD
jgi:hypothetical protein